MSEPVNLILEIDGLPYMVKATPCIYNEEVQYRVTINGDDDVLFLFDSDLGRYTAAGDDGAQVPDNVDIAIGNKLNADSLKVQKNY